MKHKFTHVGLFEGIGGFSLASKWMETRINKSIWKCNCSAGSL